MTLNQEPRGKPARYESENYFSIRDKPRGIKPFGGIKTEIKLANTL
jgi:hypothetical protein